MCIRESVSRVRTPLSPPNSKRKPGFASRLFFCMAHRREGREASTGFDKTPAFWTANGGPQGERSESTPLSPPNSKRKPGFASRLFFLHGAPPRGACAAHLPPSVTVIPISAGYPRTLPLMFSLFHGFRPAVRRSFQQSEHGLSGRTKTQKLFLTGSAPLPIVAPRCSDDFATKKYGEVSEWLKEHAWKVCIRESVSRVRIPPSPPYSTKKPELTFRLFCMHSAPTGRVRTLDRVRQNACVLDRQRRPAG